MILGLRPGGVRHRDAAHSVILRAPPHQGLRTMMCRAGRESSGGIKRDGAKRQGREDENSASRFFEDHLDSPSIGPCGERLADFDDAAADCLRMGRSARRPIPSGRLKILERRFLILKKMQSLQGPRTRRMPDHINVRLGQMGGSISMLARYWKLDRPGAAITPK